MRQNWSVTVVIAAMLLAPGVGYTQPPPTPPPRAAAVEQQAAPVQQPVAPLTQDAARGAAPVPADVAVPPDVLRSLADLQQRIAAFNLGVAVLQKEIDALSVDHNRTLARATPEGYVLAAVCPAGAETCADTERRLVFRLKPAEQSSPAPAGGKK